MARKKNKRNLEKRGQTSSAAVDDADNRPPVTSASSTSDDSTIPKFRTIIYETVKNATNDFSLDFKIGHGLFGPVYKVEALLQQSQFHAVKILDVFGRRPDSEFRELTLKLGHLRHSNLVNLVASATDHADVRQRLLVYEYIPSGTSLDKYLHERPPESKPLDWAARITIALGIARGLDYLHNVAIPSVIFRNLKTSKVLLDDTLLPKLSGFGLAELGDQRPEPADGYYAPEYIRGGQPTMESDVYTFGVILLELITGRRPRDIIEERWGNYKLYDWLYPRYQKREQNKIDEIVDEAVRGKTGTRESLFRAAGMAVLCLQTNPLTRHTMRDMVLAMERVLSEADGETRAEDPPLAVAETSKGKGKEKRKGKGKRKGNA